MLEVVSNKPEGGDKTARGTRALIARNAVVKDSPTSAYLEYKV